MSDLISREAVIQDIEWIKANTSEYNHAELDEYIERIKKIPAVDAEPVRRGRWINKGYITTAYGSIDIADCTACGAVDVPIEPYEDYCPNCGAKMEGDKND